ncbi:MAG: hypothetical protein H6746_06605 [Deltaproteobacteria bacterium]|nr:hypothetical protein [Deltaproteobacteria bacterium]
MAALVGMLTAGLGCSGDLPDVSDVEKLRVLAVCADPPELSDPGESTLRALVAGETGDVVYHWELCLLGGDPTMGFECRDEDARIDLGSAVEPTVPIPDLDPILAAAEAAGYTIDIEDGVDVQVKVTVTDGSDIRAEAIKQLRISRKSDQNSNPALTGLDVDGVDWPADQGIVVRLGQEVTLLPHADEARLQRYDDQGVEVQEEALYSWFAETGSFQKDRSSGEFPDNTWVAPTRDELDDRVPPFEIGLWLVLRDRRGGCDWTQRRIRVVEGLPQAGAPAP